MADRHEETGLTSSSSESLQRVYDSELARFEMWLGKKRILGNVYRFVIRIFQDNLIGVSAQTAFFLLLSLFPILMLAAGWLSQTPFSFSSEQLSAVFPPSVAETLAEIIDRAPRSTGYTVMQILLSVWSASAGIWALMRGICISYTGRLPNFFKGRLISMLLMVGFLAMIVLSISVWVFGKEVLAVIAGGAWRGSGMMISVARYIFTLPLLFLFVLILYAATPGFTAKSNHMAAGAVFAAVSWTLISRAFEIYMDTFSNYSALYGGVGAFLGLAVWLLVICFVILLGAEINAFLAESEKIRHGKRRIKRTIVK